MSKEEVVSEERPLIKDYQVNWKNSLADAEGLIKIKTLFRCDVKLLDSFVLTLPNDEREVICVTDEYERQAKEARISYLQNELHRLINNIPDEPCLDKDGSAPCDDECAPYDGYNRDYYQTDYYTSVTYFTKDGKDSNQFYDKEEIRRFSTRSLMLTGLIDDYTEKSAN